MKQDDILPVVRVVIARHNESVDWITAIPEDYEIYISNSGTDPVSIPKKAKHLIRIIDTRNSGREAGHWLRYIVDNYNNLTDVTIFLQGTPNVGHTADILFNIERNDIKEPFGYITSTDLQYRKMEGRGRSMIQEAVGRSYKIVPQATGGVWGGQHYVSKNVLLSNPKEYYADILTYSETDKFAHNLEHAYNCVYGIPPKTI